MAIAPRCVSSDRNTAHSDNLSHNITHQSTMSLHVPTLVLLRYLRHYTFTGRIGDVTLNSIVTMLYMVEMKAYLNTVERERERTTIQH